MNQQVLNWAYIVMLVMVIVLRKIHERKSGRERKLKETPVIEIVMMVSWGLAAGVLPPLYMFTDFLDFADLPLGMPFIRGILGTILFLTGIAMLHLSHINLGRLWSPTVNPDDSHKLVRAGVYSMIRHPMYTAHVLWGMGQALLLPNVLAGSLALFLMSTLLVFRIPREEQAMLDVFDDEYRQYMNTTGRIFPKIF